MGCLECIKKDKEIENLRNRLNKNKQQITVVGYLEPYWDIIECGTIKTNAVTDDDLIEVIDLVNSLNVRKIDTRELAEILMTNRVLHDKFVKLKNYEEYQGTRGKLYFPTFYYQLRILHDLGFIKYPDETPTIYLGYNFTIDDCRLAIKNKKISKQTRLF